MHTETSEIVRDRLEVDSRYSRSAKQYISELENSIDRMHPGQRMNAVEHAREYTVLYYGERHKNTPIPHQGWNTTDF